MASYLSIISSTLVKFIHKCVHQLIFWVGISYINWQSMCILESLNVFHFRFLSFICDLLKSPVISTFVSKSHVCKMRLQFFNALYSIHWELSNKSPAVYINICMQNIPYSLFCIIFNIIPPILGSSIITSQVYVYCENIISSDSTNVRK